MHDLLLHCKNLLCTIWALELLQCKEVPQSSCRSQNGTVRRSPGCVQTGIAAERTSTGFRMT